MIKLIGNKPNQVPTNADLGTMAYQDVESVKVEAFESNGIDDNATSTKFTVSDTGIDVTGTVTCDGLVAAEDGDDIALSGGRVSIISDTNGNGLNLNCIGTPANYFLRVQDDSATKLVINSSGNMGLGVTPKTWYSAYNGGIFSIGARHTIASETGSIQIRQNNYTDAAGNEKYVAADEAGLYTINGGTHQFKVASSGTAEATIASTGGWTTAMTIENDGQVNISNESSVTGADLTVGALGLASSKTRSIEELSSYAGTVTASGNIEIDINYGSQSAASTLVEIEIMAYSGKYLSYKHGSYWGTNWSGPHNNTVIENANSGFTVTYDTNPTNAHEVFTITNSAGITYPVIRVRALCGGHVTSTNPQITFTYTES